MGQNVKKPNAVKDAMKIYDSISAFNSEVQPNTVHLNAAANVAARGGDMDSLWALLGRAKERGAGSPDVTTYTIILNAIQRDIVKRTAELLSRDKDADISEVFKSAISDGRKVWADVVMKWRDAEINVDEQLVCAMGRLLLMSKVQKDVMDVFMLVQQTMNIRVPRVTLETKSEDAQAFDAEADPDDENGA